LRVIRDRFRHALRKEKLRIISLLHSPPEEDRGNGFCIHRRSPDFISARCAKKIGGRSHLACLRGRDGNAPALGIGAAAASLAGRAPVPFRRALDAALERG
jgi:hypothetical protein